MATRNYYTLLDVLPNVDSIEELRVLAAEAQQYLFENGKPYTSQDEVMFISLLDRYIHVFTRAKELVAKNKFTVANRGDPRENRINITDFEVIPIQKAADGR